MKKTYYLLGVIGGFLNGLFGAGGGTVVVPLLEKAGLSPKKSHATSVAIILSLSVVTSAFYFFNQKINIIDALIFLPGGIVGGIAGAFFLKKIPNNILRRIFGGLIVLSAVRILLR